MHYGNQSIWKWQWPNKVSLPGHSIFRFELLDIFKVAFAQNSLESHLGQSRHYKGNYFERERRNLWIVTYKEKQNRKKVRGVGEPQNSRWLENLRSFDQGVENDGFASVLS